MDILQFNEKKENNLCFDFLEEKIREESRRVIEALYADEVNQYLNRMASLVNENGNKLVVRNGYHKKRIIQTSCGNIEVKLPRLDDRKADEKFISKILPPFVRKTPTVETLIAALYLAGVSTNKFQEALASVAFKLCQQAEKGWRRLKGFEKLDLVAKNIEFENGVLK